MYNVAFGKKFLRLVKQEQSFPQYQFQNHVFYFLEVSLLMVNELAKLKNIIWKLINLRTYLLNYLNHVQDLQLVLNVTKAKYFSVVGIVDQFSRNSIVLISKKGNGLGGQRCSRKETN